MFMLTKTTLIFMFIATSLYAGWSSGGGEVYKDAINPWFLTGSTVNYCVEIDGKNFGEADYRIYSRISEAIGYWKDEFAKVEPVHFIKNISLGNKEFIHQSSCNDTTDLRFQMGVLSKEQQEKYVKIPQSFIGLAVRTEYDPLTLRGKGFIYISPQEGPLAPSSAKIDKKRWKHSDASLLRLALIHELGHVFGMDDSLGGIAIDIMSKFFLEEATNIDNSQVVAYLGSLNRLPSILTAGDIKWGGIQFFNPDDPSDKYRAISKKYFGYQQTAESIRILPSLLGLNVSVSYDSGRLKTVGQIQVLSEFSKDTSRAISAWIAEGPYYEEWMEDMYTDLYRRETSKTYHIKYVSSDAKIEKKGILKVENGMVISVDFVNDHGVIVRVFDMYINYHYGAKSKRSSLFKMLNVSLQKK